MNTTAIEWADKTWNYWSGCTKVSQGCKHCYAKVQAERYGAPAFPNGFGLTVRHHKLLEHNKKATGRELDGRTWDEMPSLEREAR